MDSVISTFHIDWKLLIAQIFNFAIVFGVLYYFAIRPLFKVMRERSEKIEKSLSDAKSIEQKLKDIEADRDKIIASARGEAHKILEQTRAQASTAREESLVKTREEISRLINQEKENMRREKAQVFEELKKDVANLVVLGMEKILGKRMDATREKEWLKKIL